MMLAKDPRVIQRLEQDLTNKCRAILQESDLSSNVHGVFSLDDLEKKTQNELGSAIGVGVGFSGREVNKNSDPKTSNDMRSQVRGNVAAIADYNFIVILAVPTDEVCSIRFDATTILTLLATGIVGSSAEDARARGCWEFIKDGPEVGESTNTCLYYSQHWRVRLSLTNV